MQYSSKNSGFLTWWRRELSGIFDKAGARGPESARRRLVVAVSPESVRWIEETDQSLNDFGPQTPNLEPAPKARRFLARQLRRRRAAPLGLRIDKSACLERRVLLPEAARDDFASILALDIERATPFKSSDVYAAYLEDEAAAPVAGKAALRQFIVKREILDEPRRALGAQGFEPAFADCWDETGTSRLKFNFLAEPVAAAQRTRTPFTLTAALASIALLLTATAAGLSIRKNEAALTLLDAEISRAKTEAMALRQAIDKSEAQITQAGALKGFADLRPPVERILEELTRVLPDDTYLTDFSLTGHQLSIGGLSSKAVALIAAIDASPLFEGTIAPVPTMLDAQRNKEQFRIEARITGWNKTESASREAKP